MANNTSDVSFTDYGSEQAAIQRRTKLAEMMLQQGLTPPPATESIGGWAIKRSPWEGIAKIAQAGVGAYGINAQEKQQSALAKKIREDAVTQMASMPQGTPAQPATEAQPGIQSVAFEGGVGPERAGMPAVPAQPASREAMQAWATQNMGSGNPLTKDYISKLSAELSKPVSQDTIAKEAGLDRRFGSVSGNTAANIAQRDAQFAGVSGNAAANIAQRQAEFTGVSGNTLANNTAALDRHLRPSGSAELGARTTLQTHAQPSGSAILAADTTRRGQDLPLVEIMRDGKKVLVPRDQAVGMEPAPKGKGSGQLPQAAVKLRQEELDAIGSAASINADLGALSQQIKDGKLTPSLVNSADAAIRNLTNSSTEESRNLGSYKATLEKLRNDSLRLNKGVQTEGDAQRAWNEIISNSNDTAFVQQRLGEIQKINERAINLRKMNIDAIHSNYGIDPMDTSKYENVPAAVGNSRAGDPPPSGVDVNLWGAMTPQEKALWRKKP